MNEEKVKEGWAFPGTARKAHYFVNSMALCRAWGFYNGPLEQGNDDSSDNCSTCMKALTKRKANSPADGNLIPREGG